MKEQPISDHFRDLGENLVELLRAAWERPEREKAQRDIEGGLRELGDQLNRSIGVKARTEIDSALSSVNAELEKLIRKLRDDSE